jgi:hypothetical protein
MTEHPFVLSVVRICRRRAACLSPRVSSVRSDAVGVSLVACLWLRTLSRLLPLVTPHKLECPAREAEGHEIRAHYRHALRRARSASGG